MLNHELFPCISIIQSYKSLPLMSEETKTMPISGRIAEEDYLFIISGVENGAVTASEKLRHVAHFFRRYHEGMKKYPEAVAEFTRLLDRFRFEAKAVENAEGMRSELMDRLLILLPELFAMISSFRISNKDGRKDLIEAEEQVFRAILGLMEYVLRLGITKTSPTYNPSLFKGRLNQLSDLVELANINQSLSDKE